MGIALVTGMVFGGAFFLDSFIGSSDQNASEVTIEIPPGMSVDGIAKRLREQNIITNSFLFKTYVTLINAQTSLQAGRYQMKPGLSFYTIVNQLSLAKVHEVELTIPEGFTLVQIGAVVQSLLPEITETEWNFVVSNPGLFAQDLLFVSGIPAGQTLEGYLFPDTYRFRDDANAQTIAEVMVLTLSRRLAEQGIVMSENLVLPNGMTFHEVLTLASIVEREVQTPEDMAHVAGIFLTRLKIGMALQADATVNYVTGKKEAAVSLEDAGIDSPYNTYKSVGLPPGPISNPGMHAIQAVLNPFDSDDLFYLTTSDGEVIYAQTFNAHVANKRKYLK